MKEIQEKQNLLEELRFKQRENKNHLRESINSLHKSIDEYKDLGLVDEEQYEFLKSLKVDDDMDLFDTDKFKEIIKNISEIKNQLENDSKELLKQIKELEEGVK